MRQINLSFSKPTLNINGIQFDVLRSDAQIVQDMIDIDRQFDGRDMTDVEIVLEKNKVMIGYIDKLLGKGAVKKISDTLPELNGLGLGLGGISGILSAIADAAGKAYADSFALKYDD